MPPGETRRRRFLTSSSRSLVFTEKHAIRALKKATKAEESGPRRRSRVYDEAVQQALTIVWEAADRICGKRLREIIAGLVDAMERYSMVDGDREPAVRLAEGAGGRQT